jgi:hypothetical protein
MKRCGDNVKRLRRIPRDDRANATANGFDARIASWRGFVSACRVGRQNRGFY